MSLDRRAVLKLGFAAGCLAGGTAGLRAEEVAPVFASEAQQVPYRFRRRDVSYETAEPPGTIVVDTPQRFLYFITGPGTATRYGVGVGIRQKLWSGEAVIKRKAEWPVWHPSPERLAQFPKLIRYEPDGMPGGADNPLGARAMYLYQGDADTLYRIHGTNRPTGIGRRVTSGCISMLNIDAVHLYDRVPIGTRVVVLPAA
ncbi:L,D-transpeptidase [Aestuariivirga sp.]|uniref:L,D-transpeptidase n=1 Tax=Aestuariivirga sp. TaxID=2650926 RepID=UPI0025C45FFE|nr:L,D-transpeptidase [Aestuariivirga sp.]